MSGRVLDIKQRKAVATTAVGASLAGVRLAKLAALAQDGVWVELEPGSRVLARVCVDWDSARLAQAVAQGQSGVVAFDDGDAAKPLLLAIANPEARKEPAGLEVEADADGQRVRLIAQQEIVLQCGESSITLKHNGRVIIRGTYVETYASGTNRIKGGSVRIN